MARRSEVVREFVGHVFNVQNPRDFEHVENVLHEKITASPRPVGSTHLSDFFFARGEFEAADFGEPGGVKDAWI